MESGVLGGIKDGLFAGLRVLQPQEGAAASGGRVQEGGCMLSDGLGPRAGGYSEAVSVVVSTDAAGTAWTVL